MICGLCKRKVNCNKIYISPFDKSVACCECHGAGSFCLPDEHEETKPHFSDGERNARQVSDFIF